MNISNTAAVHHKVSELIFVWALFLLLSFQHTLTTNRNPLKSKIATNCHPSWQHSFRIMYIYMYICIITLTGTPFCCMQMWPTLRKIFFKSSGLDFLTEYCNNKRRKDWVERSIQMQRTLHETTTLITKTEIWLYVSRRRFRIPISTLCRLYDPQ